MEVLCDHTPLVNWLVLVVSREIPSKRETFNTKGWPVDKAGQEITQIQTLLSDLNIDSTGQIHQNFPGAGQSSNSINVGKINLETSPWGHRYLLDLCSLEDARMGERSRQIRRTIEKESPRYHWQNLNLYDMEVCVDSMESALNAEKGGAFRIELCSSLSEGGLTPSVGFLKTVKTRLGIPIFVMIRCRGGNFVYSDDEIQIMEEDIRLLKANGADGFVLGVLDDNGEVDYEKNKILIDECSPFPVTFHRAFDEVIEPMRNFDLIVKLGCTRLLTSGCQKTAHQGMNLIKQLVSRNQLIVMPGAGINIDNVEDVLRETGAREFHGSAKLPITDKHGHTIDVTNANLVHRMTEIYKKVVFCKECTSCHCRHKLT